MKGRMSMKSMDIILGIFIFSLLRISDTQAPNKTYTHPNPQKCAYDTIMADYNKEVVPVQFPKQQINVTLRFVFRSLAEINEKDEVMNVVGYFRSDWVDFQLQWNPEDCGGIEQVKLPAYNVWLPDFTIANSVIDYHQYSFKRDFSLWVRYDGLVYYAYGGMFQVSCFMDLTHYPFDQHNCSIILESWVLTAEELSLTVLETTFDTQSLDRDAMWSMGGMTAYYEEVAVGWPAASVSFLWKRKTAYPVYNLICPTVLILVVALGVFWLPADCGEKISLSVTVLLAFSVIQLLIMEILPENSDNMPNLSLLVIGVMILSTLSVLSSMIVVFLTFKPVTSPPPRYLRKLLYSRITMIFGLRAELPVSKFYELDDSDIIMKAHKAMTTCKRRSENEQIFDVLSTLNQFNKGSYLSLSTGKHEKHTKSTLSREARLLEMKLNVLEEILIILKVFMQNKKEESKDDNITKEWKVIAKLTDRVFFILCLSLLIAWGLVTYYGA